METKKIEKIIKIGKWVIGVGAVLNITVWLVLGMLAYKYIYLDHFDSKYKKHANRDTYYNDLNTLGLIKSLDELHTVYYTNLFKDEIDDLKGNRCNNFSLEDINKFVTDTNKTIDDYLNLETYKITETNFLNYGIAKGNFKNDFNCRNIKYTIFLKLIEAKQTEIGRIRIDVDDLEFNEYLDNDLHRVSNRYKIIDEQDNKRVYIDINSKTFITINRNGSIDIVYPTYTERLLKIADKYYGSREKTLDHTFFYDDSVEIYKGFNFFALFLEETNKVPSNAKEVLIQVQKDRKRQNDLEIKEKQRLSGENW